MNKDRRDFIKKCGMGAGAMMLSGFMLDSLQAGVINDDVIKVVAERFGVTKEDMSKLLEIALSKGGKFSELYFEYKISNSVTMSEDIIKNSSESVSLGVGIRVINGKQTGYAYTNELTFDKMKEAALTAAAIASSTNNKVNIQGFDVVKPKHQVYDMNNVVSDMDLNPKIDLLKRAYNTAMKHDNRIKKATAAIADEVQFIALANSEGLFAHDIRPQARFMVYCTAEDGKNRNTGSYNLGGRVGSKYYTGDKSPETIGRKAAEEAILLLSAEDAPAGEMPVVLSKDQSGVMIHEAVGHPLEADANWKKQSIMWDKYKTEVASPLVTIYDDATIPEYRGSLNIDDEGIETQNTMLIEKGKLVGYLNDRLSAGILGHELNGHGRRQSYKHPPIPRMNNTVLAQGDSTPEEIIKSVKHGFYAVTYQGGQVSNTGKFTFSVNQGFLIEDGKLTKPLKNATLIGTNVQILKEVEMIGNDMGYFLGTCGKEGQSVPVTCGTPTLKIRKMTVGGQA